MNTPVNFELAKRLKKKGFDEDVRVAYNAESGKYTIFLNETITVKAPTIAEVVMWLYEKHRIWIEVNIDINGKIKYVLRQYNSTDIAWECKNPTSISEHYQLPKEAYEAAIEYTLKNLI